MNWRDSRSCRRERWKGCEMHGIGMEYGVNVGIYEDLFSWNERDTLLMAIYTYIRISILFNSWCYSWD